LNLQLAEINEKKRKKKKKAAGIAALQRRKQWFSRTLVHQTVAPLPEKGRPIMRCHRRIVFAITVLALLASRSIAQQPADSIEPQTRGPIHEAFLQPLDAAAEPGMPVPKAPPPAINELPPDEQPEGNHVQWMPGYWAWDADRSDFLWVSGFWRDVPPGRQYVPGYWTSTPEGWRWVQGFWSAEQQVAVQTVPPPPASLGTEPALPPPDDSSAYVPGSWIYRETRYAWRPGYWTAFRPGLVWVPARYLWTPAGYVFIDGYWDLPLENRGLLFAPVAFSGAPWLNPGWGYTPDYVVSPWAICDSSFYRPRSGHFYFGNYYGGDYAALGFRPWFTGAGRYDPAFSHYAWQQRGTPNWFANYQQNYQARAQGTLAAPPRTFAQQSLLLKQANHGNATAQNSRTVMQRVTPLSQVTQLNKNVTIVRITPAQLNAHKVAIQHSQQLVQARKQFDTVATKGPGQPAVARTLRLPTTVKSASSAPAIPPVFSAGVKTPSGPALLPKMVSPPSSIAKYTPAPQVHHIAPAVMPKVTPTLPSSAKFTPAPQVQHIAPAVTPKVNPTPWSAPKLTQTQPKFAAPVAAPKVVAPAFHAPSRPVTAMPKYAAPKTTYTAPRVAPAVVRAAPHFAPAIVHPAPRVAPAVVRAAPHVAPAPVRRAAPAAVAHAPAKSGGPKHH
jgi:hypothetical protein